MLRAEVRGPSPTEIMLFEQRTRAHFERAALRTVATIAARGKVEVRRAFAGADLGRLGNAITSGSDAKNGRVMETDNGGFRASAQFYVRTRSERTLGAIESYTEGANITPVRSRWLWIATDEIPQFVGSRRSRRRMTPSLYRERGFDRTIGPLTTIKSVNGRPLLVARNVGVSAVGLSRSAKSLTKTGRPKKGQRKKEFVVAFVGIPRTSRAARVNITAILKQVAQDVPALFDANMGAEV